MSNTEPAVPGTLAAQVASMSQTNAPANDAAAKKAAEKAAKDAEKAAKDAKKAEEKAALQAKRDAEKAAKKAEAEAKKAEAEKNKYVAPVQNDQARPRPNTVGDKLWTIFDELTAKRSEAAGKKFVPNERNEDFLPCAIEDAKPLVEAAGIKLASMTAAYNYWRKFHGVSGRVESDAAVERKAVAAKAAEEAKAKREADAAAAKAKKAEDAAKKKADEQAKKDAAKAEADAKKAAEAAAKSAQVAGDQAKK